MGRAALDDGGVRFMRFQDDFLSRKEIGCLRSGLAFPAATV
jgi:hypothetical protein